MEKVTVTYKGKVIGTGTLPEIKSTIYPTTKDSQLYTLPYETTKNGVNDFEDQTEVFRRLYKKHEKGITSTNKSIQSKAVLDFIAVIEKIAGRSLSSSDYKNIIKQAKHPYPRMKINKYGRCFGKRLNGSNNKMFNRDDLIYKGGI